MFRILQFGRCQSSEKMSWTCVAGQRYSSPTAISTKAATSENKESSWSKASSSSMPINLLLVRSPFTLFRMSPFENSTLMILVPLSPRMAVRRRLQALIRDVLRSAEARADEIYMRGHSFTICEMPRLIFCNDWKVNKE